MRAAIPRTTLGGLASNPELPVSQNSPARKAFVILRAVVIAGVILWGGSRILLISGTKATFSFVTNPSPPAGGPGGPTRPATTLTSTTTTATAATSTTTGGR